MLQNGVGWMTKRSSGPTRSGRPMLSSDIASPQRGSVRTSLAISDIPGYFYSSTYLETASQVTEYKELVYSCLVPSGRVAATINVSQVLNLQNVMSPAVLQVLL